MRRHKSEASQQCILRCPSKHSPLLAAELALVWSLFEADEADNDTYVEAMIRVIENVCPGAKYGPQTCTKGVNAFFDFEHPLTEEESENLIQEVQVRFVWSSMATSMC